MPDPQADFDFLFGRWKVHNRRLRERLKGSSDLGRVRVHGRSRGRSGAARATSTSTKACDPGRTHPGRDAAPVQPALASVEHLLVDQRHRRAGHAHDRLVQGRPRRVLRPGDVRGPQHLRALHLVAPDAHLLPLGAGLLGGRRKTWETNWIMDFTRDREAAPERDCCTVVELRRYVMKPGRRDDLIAVFEKHFIEGQEKHDMRILGTFADRQEPDRFVWIRGFPGMEARSGRWRSSTADPSGRSTAGRRTTPWSTCPTCSC